MRLRFWRKPAGEPVGRDEALRALRTLRTNRLLRPRTSEPIGDSANDLYYVMQTGTGGAP